MWVGLESCRGIDIRALERLVEAGVAKLGQRRWDEVPVSMSSQVRILPSALFNQDENLAHVSVRKVSILPSTSFSKKGMVKACQTTRIRMAINNNFSFDFKWLLSQFQDAVINIKN